MQSKTSFFNKTLLRKNLTRFAPLWCGYLLCMVLVLVLMAQGNTDYWFARSYADWVTGMAAVNLGIAFLAVQVLFGDLYSTRMCYGMHAFPLRREGIYTGAVSVGLLCSLVPTAVFALVSLPMLARTPVTGATALAGYFWASANLQYLFFFGCAVVCAMLAGNRLGMTALYGMINLGGGIAYMLAKAAFTPLLYGVITPDEPFGLASPIMYEVLEYHPLIEMHNRSVLVGPNEWEIEGWYNLGTGWGYLAVTAAVGIACLLLGLLLYRRRALECAGDFLAGKKLETPVLVCETLCAGTAAATVATEMGRNRYGVTLVFWAVGLTAGWLVGKMLLERSTRIFRLKNLRGLVLVAAAMAICLGLTKIDIFGIETRIPEESEISSATIWQGNPVQDMGKLRLFHAQALDDRMEDMPYNNWPYNPVEDDIAYIPIIYTLDNGFTLHRRYPVKADSPAGQTAKELLSDISMVFARYRAPEEAKSIRTVEDVMGRLGEPVAISAGPFQLDEQYINRETLQELVVALAADCAEYRIAQLDLFHPPVQLSTGDQIHVGYNLSVSFAPTDNEEDWNYLDVDFYTDSIHTLKALEKLGITAEMLNTQWEDHPLG